MPELDADALVVRAAVVERLGDVHDKGIAHLAERGETVGLSRALAHQLGVLVPRSLACRLRQRGDMPDAEEKGEEDERQQSRFQGLELHADFLILKLARYVSG